MPNNLISAELSQQLIKDDCKSFNIRKDNSWKEFVAIVRCKDCIYYGDHGDGEMACAMMILYPNKPTDFCSCGKKQEYAEPIRHGKWLKNGYRYCECSECHHEGNTSGHDNYCWYCGAKMDGIGARERVVTVNARY